MRQMSFFAPYRNRGPRFLFHYVPLQRNAQQYEQCNLLSCRYILPNDSDGNVFMPRIHIKFVIRIDFDVLIAFSKTPGSVWKIHLRSTV